LTPNFGADDAIQAFAGAGDSRAAYDIVATEISSPHGDFDTDFRCFDSGLDCS
jgi:hypothetical protein